MMQVKIHPTHGVAVREDGAVCVRKKDSRRFYWFYGYKNVKGYCKVMVKGKYRHVGRLVLETFVGIPEDSMQCDHIDRNRSNNNAKNLRWVTATENSRNTRGNDRSKNLYGCNWYKDKNGYSRAWSKAHRESRNLSARKYRAKHKEAA